MDTDDVKKCISNRKLMNTTLKTFLSLERVNTLRQALILGKLEIIGILRKLTPKD